LTGILLGEGHCIENGNWKIETTESKNSVLLQVNGNQFSIDAIQPFVLTMPVPDEVEIEVLLKSEDMSEIYSAEVLKKTTHKYVPFNLPAMKHKKLEIIYR